ncbi:MAG: hypothetical protein EOP83_36355 [Verrucomicrobiaceae bacterium]|nr:MAG: hypothetical protein EOP83_36355 [Verrucomicrobiaceae bacterium]
MGYQQDREDRRVREGETIVDAIMEAIRLRDPRVVHPLMRAENSEYRQGMMVLLDAFQQIARDEISQRENDLSYDG